MTSELRRTSYWLGAVFLRSGFSSPVIGSLSSSSQYRHTKVTEEAADRQKTPADHLLVMKNSPAPTSLHLVQGQGLMNQPKSIMSKTSIFNLPSWCGTWTREVIKQLPLKYRMLKRNLNVVLAEQRGEKGKKRWNVPWNQSDLANFSRAGSEGVYTVFISCMSFSSTATVTVCRTRALMNTHYTSS